ncbi:MAG: Rieske 2Fe-2S domain-containing protein [Candidatus Latescibacteria bacterium]|nr:Rieske 2Fe-2S domain-containing protein [Candidatus Latescibacterota bacterium]NIO27207.1 Rieske 2Fe-2S domain-containing protein [Candidatus Latescibacterota bacterium]NIO54731.1 Rieske 2Fe-2S domain-containing protein [Candidatus Latescibacterota bacterium]NIT00814.1 Rieske 2Fe-2S domain-containing protein [Candidatus Latescibacterota bacterium]NIT37737.1 Rieske 2Fe-2S domain-containing protein [Candidatus Latescibacterota bacterium]
MKIKVCQKTDIPEDTIQGFEIEGEMVLIANVGGQLHAISDTCSHEEALLSEGEFDPETCEVMCPLHGAAFDVRTGEVLSPPAMTHVASYPISIEGDDVYIEIEDV